MSKRIVCIVTAMMAIAVFAAAVHAQDGAAEQDPFYPSSGWPAATMPDPVDNSWGRDPFSNPLTDRAPTQARTTPSSGRSRVLTGIIHGKDVRLAIIGGEALREGSKVGDRKLVDIRSRSVVFMTAAGEREEVFLEAFSMGR